jgi:drug/metabolite transporter (DMT)-like permease
MLSSWRLIGFLLLSLIWGSTWAAIRVVVEHMPPLRSVSLRFLIASVILLPVMWLSGARRPRGREWGVLGTLSVLTIVIPFSVTAWAEGRISSGVTSILFSTSPLVTAWMEPHLGRRTQRRAVPRAAHLAMLFGFGGALLVLTGVVARSSAQAAGAAAVLAMVVLGSVTVPLARPEIREIPLVTVTAVQCAMSAAVLAAGSLVLEHGRPTDWTRSSVLALIFLGVFSSAVGFLLFYWLMVELRPYQLAARQLIMPIVAVAEGAILLHEAHPWTMLVGTGMVVVSMFWVLRIDGGDVLPDGRPNAGRAPLRGVTPSGGPPVGRHEI